MHVHVFMLLGHVSLCLLQVVIPNRMHIRQRQLVAKTGQCICFHVAGSRFVVFAIYKLLSPTACMDMKTNV